MAATASRWMRAFRTVKPSPPPITSTRTRNERTLKANVAARMLCLRARWYQHEGRWSYCRYVVGLMLPREGTQIAFFALDSVALLGENLGLNRRQHHGQRKTRVDAYIAKSADFAKPILNHISAVVHEACPEVEEEMKWSRPHFTYKGMFCAMVGVQGALRLRVLERLADPRQGWKESRRRGGPDSGGSRRSRTFHPRKSLTEYIKLAKKLNDDGVKSPMRAKKKEHPELVVPEDLAKALKAKQGGGRPLSTSSVPATSANTWPGSPRPRPRRPGPGGSRRPSNGWPRESRGTGST